MAFSCNYLHIIRSVYVKKLLKNDSRIIKFTPAPHVNTTTSRVSSVVWYYPIPKLGAANFHSFFCTNRSLLFERLGKKCLYLWQREVYKCGLINLFSLAVPESFTFYCALEQHHPLMPRAVCGHWKGYQVLYKTGIWGRGELGSLLQGFVVTGYFCCLFSAPQPSYSVIHFWKKPVWVVLSSALQPFADTPQGVAALLSLQAGLW